MTLLQSYLSFFQEICEGRRAAPRGFALPEGGVEARAAALQEQIAKSGIPAFVKACAAEAGLEIPQAEYDGFDEAAFYSALGQLAQQAQAQQAAPEAAEAAETREDAAEPEPAKSEIRDIYEVFLDSVSLDDALVQYLIDIARRGDRQEFQTLSHAAARTLLDLDEFLLWLGNKEKLAPPEERACVLVMDACLDRLAREGAARAAGGALVRRRDDLQALPRRGARARPPARRHLRVVLPELSRPLLSDAVSHEVQRRCFPGGRPGFRLI